MQPHTVAVVCSTANVPAPECCSGVRESQAGSVNSQDSWGQRTGSGHLWLGHVLERVKSLIYAKNSHPHSIPVPFVPRQPLKLSLKSGQIGEGLIEKFKERGWQTVRSVINVKSGPGS